LQHFKNSREYAPTLSEPDIMPSPPWPHHFPESFDDQMIQIFNAANANDTRDDWNQIFDQANHVCDDWGNLQVVTASDDENSSPEGQ
jgi:hypothetical protein